MSSKRRILDDDESEEGSEQEYHVEVITKAQVAEDGTLKYRVKWYGYPSDDDSWEPEENVSNCTVLLKKFWKHVPYGREKKHNPGPPGTTHSAEDSWIERERKFFRESMKKNEDEKKKEEKARKRKEESMRVRHIPQKAIKLTAVNDAPSRERQLEHDKLRASLFSEDVEGSESDEPLSSKAKLTKPDKGKMKVKSSNDDRGTAAASSSKPGDKAKTIPPPKQASTPAPGPASQKSKLAGLKIPRKSATSTVSQPSPTTTPPVNRMDVDSPSAPVQKAPPPASSTSLPRRPISIQAAPVFTSTQPPPAAASPAVPATADDVDNFMATIMPFNDSIAQKPENLALSPVSPVTATAPSNPVVSRQVTSLTSAPSSPRRHTEYSSSNGVVWRWSGELLLDTTNATERLCEINITDSTNTAEDGFRLDLFLDSKTSFRISKAYNRFEIEMLVRALRKVDSVARVTLREEKDRVPFTTLVRYLKSADLVMAAPVITDNGHVAQMIIFPAPLTTQPSENRTLTSVEQLFLNLNVPNQYLGNDSLIIALMPWVVLASKYPDLSLKSDELKQQSQDKLLEEVKASQSLSSFRVTMKVERAIRILGFPAWFLSFIPTRQYCIWAYPVEPYPKDYGQDFTNATRKETVSLCLLLKHLKAMNVGYKADVRVIFVHVGALTTINKLPALTDRRCKRPEIRFITYGSHECVKPTLWGFDEIFPLGGVVTFTFTALLENPVAVADIIEQVSSHRLWTCYILPSVLSIFIRLACGDDPVSTYAQEPWRLGRIMRCIDEGKLALMRSPPISEQTPPGSDTNPCEDWIAAQYAGVSKSSADIVEEAWATYVANYAMKSEEETRQDSEGEIVKDLINLQVQPCIRRRYRRFAVIKAIQDTHIPYDRDGFEWRTVQDFDFRDNHNTRAASVESPTL